MIFHFSSAATLTEIQWVRFYYQTVLPYLGHEYAISFLLFCKFLNTLDCCSSMCCVMQKKLSQYFPDVYYVPCLFCCFQKILSEHSGPSTDQNQSSNVNTVSGRHSSAENPRSVLSPLTNSLLEQLEARIKELKAWLRDTELLIFNSCLRQDKDAAEQLQNFKVREMPLLCHPCNSGTFQ